MLTWLLDDSQIIVRWTVKNQSVQQPIAADGSQK